MITVLLFAHLKDDFGTDRLRFDWREGTVRQLIELLQAEYPSARLQNVMAAVNEQLRNKEELVQAGDTVALLPPVSGG